MTRRAAVVTLMIAQLFQSGKCGAGETLIAWQRTMVVRADFADVTQQQAPRRLRVVGESGFYRPSSCSIKLTTSIVLNNVPGSTSDSPTHLINSRFECGIRCIPRPQKASLFLNKYYVGMVWRIGQSRIVLHVIPTLPE